MVDDWRAELTPAQYRVVVLGGDDPDFDNAFHDHFEAGGYGCVGCQARLFDSADKFDAGTGAPSFSRAVAGAVSVVHDPRPGHGDEQLVCARCGAKLGHLHHDGPAPSGLRYCTNSTAFRFLPAAED